MRPGRQLTMPRYPLVIVIAIVSSALQISCTSRYNLKLFVSEGAYRDEVKMERTEFLRDTRLGDPMAAEKLVRGEGNCLMLITGHRGHILSDREEDLISFDRYVQHRLFIQFPREFEPGDYDLSGISFAQLLGRYELPVEDKIYFPTTGSLTIDSIPGDKLFGTMNASYENRKGEMLTFEGRFRAGIKR